MKASRLAAILRAPHLWIALLAVILVLFPFDWLSMVWPAYGQVFKMVFVSESRHLIGHTTLFLLAGLLVLVSLPQLLRHPLLYALLMVVGSVGEEFFQALSKWHLPDPGDGRDLLFDALGFTLAFLLGWLWWRFSNASGRRSREGARRPR